MKKKLMMTCLIIMLNSLNAFAGQEPQFDFVGECTATIDQKIWHITYYSNEGALPGGQAVEGAILFSVAEGGIGNQTVATSLADLTLSTNMTVVNVKNRLPFFDGSFPTTIPIADKQTVASASGREFVCTLKLNKTPTP